MQTNISFIVKGDPYKTKIKIQTNKNIVDATYQLKQNLKGTITL